MQVRDMLIDAYLYGLRSELTTIYFRHLLTLDLSGYYTLFINNEGNIELQPPNMIEVEIALDLPTVQYKLIPVGDYNFGYRKAVQNLWPVEVTG